MRPFHVSIFTAERDFYNGDVQSLIVPTIDGAYGIQAGHRNLIAPVVTGDLEMILPDGEKFYVAVSSGIVKVEKGEVLVLVQQAYTEDELEILETKVKREEEEEERLQKRTEREFTEAEAALRRAIYRIRTKKYDAKHLK